MTGITNPTEEYFKDGLWGWDGTQWRKQGLLFGYRSPLSQSISFNVTVAGTNSMSSDTVEENYCWIVQLVNVIDAATIPTRVTIKVIRSGNEYIIVDYQPAGSGLWWSTTLELLLVAGDRIDAVFFGCNVGDTLYLKILGYKVSLT